MSKIANNLSIFIFDVLLRFTFSFDSITKWIQIICLNLNTLPYTLSNKSSHVEIIY